MICVLTYARHLVPGDVHGQVGHLGSDPRQADEPLQTVWDVASELLLQHGSGRLQKLHLVLVESGGRRQGSGGMVRTPPEPCGVCRGVLPSRSPRGR